MVSSRLDRRFEELVERLADEGLKILDSIEKEKQTSEEAGLVATLLFLQSTIQGRYYPHMHAAFMTIQGLVKRLPKNEEESKCYHEALEDEPNPLDY